MSAGNSEGFASGLFECSRAALRSASALTPGRPDASLPSTRGDRGPGERPATPREGGTKGDSERGRDGSPPEARRSASESGERFGLGRAWPGDS